MNDPLTIPHLFAATVARSKDEPALGSIRDGQLSWRSWSQLAEDVGRLAVAIAISGVQPGDRVAHVSENRAEWIVTDLAIHVARAVHVPIHSTLPAAQVLDQIVDSDARLVFVSNQGWLRQLEPCRQQGVQLVAYDGPNTLAEFIVGVTHDQAMAVIDAVVKTTRPDELATILYTSGTTGKPRGVMLSQSNLASNAKVTAAALDGKPHETHLNFLPLSHIYARTCDLYCWVVIGSRLALAENRETILRDIALVQPQLMNAVPYFYQKLHDRVRTSGADDEAAALRRLLGENMRSCCCGGAALAPEVERWFADCGLAILPGYGLTESSPVIAASTHAAHRPGTVGRPLPGVEVRISDDGELLVRGPNVMMGYWRDAAATAEVIQDGWLCTGDLAEIDADGFVAIRGRKKELIVLSTGKNVAPTRVEGLLAASPLIEQVAVVGDGRSHLGAIIVPCPGPLKVAMRKRRIFVWSARQALRHRKVRALYAAEIAERLRDATREEQVYAFTLLDRGFEIERGEVTPKLSLRREVIQQNFAREIEAMYAKSEVPKYPITQMPTS